MSLPHPRPVLAKGPFKASLQTHATYICTYVRTYNNLRTKSQTMKHQTLDYHNMRPHHMTVTIVSQSCHISAGKHGQMTSETVTLQTATETTSSPTMPESSLETLDPHKPTLLFVPQATHTHRGTKGTPDTLCTCP